MNESASPEGQSWENHINAGRRGEALALDHLLRLGYRLRHRNFRFHRGELDLVMEAPDGDLVFVEVKSSRQDVAGDPAGWVTPRKQRQIQKVARDYCLLHGELERSMRFDVVTVELDFMSPGSANIRHIPNAFLPETGGYY
jgi:putative endonuclease